MSKVRKGISFIFLLTLLIFCMVGCKKTTTAVEDIYFNLPNDQIVLLKGETLSLKEYVNVQPSYATVKSYTLCSKDENVINVNNKTIYAVGEGSTQLIVTSNDNELKQDIVTVTVVEKQVALSKPEILYDSENGNFNITPIKNATSYTVKINNKEPMNIGNATSFALPEDCYNKVTVVRVQANAPTYTYAITNSDYSKEYKIYQASTVSNAAVQNGILNFNKINNCKFKIMIDNEEIGVINNNTYSLKNLDEKFAGVSSLIKIQTLINDDIKQEGVDYYNSQMLELPINVLCVTQAELIGTSVSWQGVPYVSSYSIYVNGVQKYVTNTNRFDLHAQSNFDDIFLVGQTYNLKVVPNIENTSNLGKTTIEPEILVQKLGGTVINCIGDNIVWDAVENAATYKVKLMKNNEVAVLSATTSTVYSLKNLESGEYIASIQAVANNQTEINYFPSIETEKVVTKLETLSAEISNYVLNITNKNVNDVLDVKIDNQEYSANVNNAQLDLTNIEFAAGNHTITLKRKLSGCVDSAESTVSFTQLDKINSLVISNGVARVNRTSINQNAQIVLKTTSSKLTTPVEINGTNCVYNTTNPLDLNYLPAGNDYKTEVWVLGDGSRTFSYREKDGNGNLQVVSSANVNFTVLAAPKNFEIEKDTGVLTFEYINNKYLVRNLDNNDEVLINANSYNISLNSGSDTYRIQSIGNGSSTLNSVLSSEVTVIKLNTPTMKFNNTNNSINIQTQNEVGRLDYKLKHNNEEIRLGDNVDYSALGSHVLTLQDIAVDNDGSNNIFYLNSAIYRVVLNKVSNAASISLVNNSLEISTVHDTEYDLKLVFNCNNGEKVYNLSKTNKELDYTYSIANRKYTIKLIDENFNAIDEDMLTGFNVKVMFKPVHSSTGDNLIASEYSNVSANFNFAKLNNVTTVSTNTKNQIVIQPSYLNKEFALSLIINDVEYHSIDGVLTTESGNITIPYTYDSGKYLIDIYDEYLNSRISSLGSSFNVQVKYKHFNNDVADMDSSYTAAQTLQIMEASEIEKVGQSLKIKNVNPNYTYANYAFIINNSTSLLLLNNTCEKDGEYFIIDINYIYCSSSATSGVNAVQVVTINSRNGELTLANKGETVLVEKADKINLIYSKNNAATNNSAVISFNAIDTNYDKQYIVEISNSGKTNLIRKTFVDDNALNGVISFNMDDISLEGVIYIDVYVLTLQESYGNVVYVFNSNVSDVVAIDKISAPVGFRVVGNTLSWTAQADAFGYEVYEKTGVEYNKLTGVLTSNSYTINITNATNFVVKAISKTNNASNSSYSQIIAVDKIVAPIVSVEGGRFKAELDPSVFMLMGMGVDLLPQITNGDTIITINLSNLGDGIELQGTTLYIEPEMVMMYSGTSVLPENLTVTIQVLNNSARTNVYYVNSTTVDITAYGLFAPVGIEKTTNANNSIELISWADNDKNQFNGTQLAVGYIVKFTYNGKDYLSSDKNLKYTADGLSYSSIITSKEINFPYGYYNEESGNFDIVFGAGTYNISVKTVPIDGTGNNFTQSIYSTIESQLEIMSPVSVTVRNGVVAWTSNSKATDYQIFISKPGEITAYSTIVKTSSYDLNSNVDLKNYEGVYKVVVKALSSRNDTLNSAESVPAYVYRLPQAIGVSIEDGYLFMTAAKYFTTAEIVFKSATNTKVVTYTNDKAAVNLSSLNIENWLQFNGMLETDVYCIDISSLVAGNEYSVSIKLCGNSHESLGLLSSSVAEENFNNIKVAKLKASTTDVSTGIIKFGADSSYADLTDINLNYAFNGTNQTENSFWNKTKVYKINVTTSVGLVNIYAVDYFNFLEYYNLNSSNLGVKEIDNTEYFVFNKTNENTLDLCGYVIYNCANGEKLYFNVYYNNTINLRDNNYVYYYPINEVIEDGVVTLTSGYTYKNINLLAGGSFAVNVYMLGGDGNGTIGYLTSSEKNVGTFIRYGENMLTTYKGQVQFDNMVNAVDNPVYKIVVSTLDNSENSTFYMYHSTEQEARAVAARLDENANSAIYLLCEENVENASKLLFDLSQYFTAGVYNVSIRTLAGFGVEDVENAQDFLLNATEPSVAYQFKKLSDTSFEITNGVLKFNQSYVKEDDVFIYYENYEITINDGETNYVYMINRNSDGVTIKDSTHTVTYDLPSAIRVGNKTLIINSTKQYNIKIRAVSKDDYIINATFAKVGNDDVNLDFVKSKGVSNVKVENGVLKWVVNDMLDYVQTVIKINYNGENIIINGGTAHYENGVYQYHYFEFGDGKYNLETAGTAAIVAGVQYSVQLYTKGKDDIINSDYSAKITMQRLATVETSSVVTRRDGYLTWMAINGAKEYKIDISNVGLFTSATNSLDLSVLNLDVEEYSIIIKAIGTTMLHSVSTETTGFEKLQTVKPSSIVISGSDIIWEAVENAEAYNIEFEYIPSYGVVKASEIVTGCRINAPTNVNGVLKVIITAIGSGKIINSEPVEYNSTNDVPAGVQGMVYDKPNSRYIITTSEDFGKDGSDKLLISYVFEEYSSDGLKSAVSVKETINYQKGLSVYYFNLKSMGKYTNLMVQVVRDKTVPSVAVLAEDIDLHLFSYGAGSVDNPYRIENATQLLNITYFKKSHYILTSSIRMNSVDIASRIQMYNAIISDEFQGVLNGNGFTIFDFNTNENEKTDTINVNNANNFSLFGILNNATISDLTIGVLNIDLLINNKFNANNSNEVKFALIATSANNVNIDNVKVLGLKMKLLADKTNAINEVLNGKIYVSGLIAVVENTTITNSSADVMIEIDIDLSNDLYLSGVIASAKGTSQITGCDITFKPHLVGDNVATFVGGVVGYYEGSSAKAYGVKGTSVVVEYNNIKSLYVGGLVGFAKYINIVNSETTGSITYLNINYETNIGGLVGVAQSSIIEESGTLVEFVISVNNIISKYIGAIAGRLTVVNSISGEVINCYVGDDYDYVEQSTISTSGITIGMWTHKDSAVVVTKKAG